MKVLYLCLIIIHSLLHGPRALQGVPQTHIIFPSAAFCIRIFGLADRYEKKKGGEKSAGRQQVRATVRVQMLSGDGQQQFQLKPIPSCSCSTFPPTLWRSHGGRDEPQEVAEIGVALMLAGPSQEVSVGVASRCCAGAGCSFVPGVPGNAWSWYYWEHFPGRN